MRFLTLFFSIILFACDTSSLQKAYNDYYKNQQIYLDALLNNNKNLQKKALKQLIECGEYLNIDVSSYKKKYNKLQNNSKVIKTKKNSKKSVFNKYIKIHSLNPLKITIPNNKIKHFTINKKNNVKEVIDIKDAITPKFIKKKIGNIKLRIAQFNKSTVRIVYSSNKHFNLEYTVKNNKLYAFLDTQKSSSNKIAKNYKTNNTKSITFNHFYNKKVIVIDPGHGGKDPGGIGLYHIREKDIVLKIGKYLYKELKKRGYIVYMTRKGDYFIPLRKRTHYANLKKADLFISIHCNIAPFKLTKPKGIEVYYLSPTRNERALRVAKIENKEVQGLGNLDQRVILDFLNKNRIIDSQKLGIDIMNNVIKTVRSKFSITNGGVRPAPFWVLVGTQMPAILIESGYLTNPIEVKHLNNSSYQKLIAKGIARGIEAYFRKNY